MTSMICAAVFWIVSIKRVSRYSVQSQAALCHPAWAVAPRGGGYAETTTAVKAKASASSFGWTRP
jgi:hypothetical protein